MGLESSWVDIFGLFVLLSGFVVGLGAVTVIDIHGFLGRKSSYWIEATTRTHKVTKPMIWVGIILAILGGLIFYRNDGFSDTPLLHAGIAVALILNGLYLSLRISPYMITREKEGRSGELIPMAQQKKVIASLIVSDVLWWGALLLLSFYLIQN